MKAKRIIASVMCAAMVMALATSCGEKPASSTAGPASGSAPASSAAAPVSAENYFPLKENIKVSIAGVRDDAGVPFEDTQSFKDLETKTNIDVEWIDWPQSVQKEKRNLTFASGVLPDAFYGSWSFDKPDIVSYGNDGLLLELNKYLTPEYMPNMSKIIEKQEGLKTALSTPDGKIYALPSLNMHGLSLTNDTLLINSEWLKAVNKPMPTTIDELYDVLKAFKAAGDLNGNGKNDEIPMSFKYCDGNAGLFGFMGFTGLTSNNKNSRMALKDNNVVFYPATEEYKEVLTYLNKLSADDLLDQEVFTMDNPAYNAKTQAAVPSVGVMSAWSAENINRALPDNDPTKDGVYVYLPPLQGKAGVKPVWSARVNALNANLSFAISAKTKYPEELVRWIDTFYSTEESFRNNVGIPDVHVKSEGGNKWSHLNNAEGKRFKPEDMYPLVPNKFATFWLFDEDYTFTDDVVSKQGKAAADAIYGPYLDGYCNDYVMSTPEENDKMAFLATDLFAYVDQATAKFVTKGGIEEGWDAYIAQLEKLNVKEYTQIKADIHKRATAK